MDDLIPLDDICEKYFQLRPNVARRMASLGTLPIPAFRLGGPKSALFVREQHLRELVQKREAEYIEKAKKVAAASAG